MYGIHYLGPYSDCVHANVSGANILFKNIITK